jgi:protoporphyrinogen IX oxidase
MDTSHSLALTIHIIGFAMWIGSLFGIAGTLVARDEESDEAVRARVGKIARTHGRPADIGAALALIGGLWLLFSAPDYYLHQPWLHAKLALVVGLFALHGFIRMKAKRASTQGAASFPKPLLPAMSLLAMTIVALVVFKPWAK